MKKWYEIWRNYLQKWDTLKLFTIRRLHFVLYSRGVTIHRWIVRIDRKCSRYTYPIVKYESWCKILDFRYYIWLIDILFFKYFQKYELNFLSFWVHDANRDNIVSSLNIVICIVLRDSSQYSPLLYRETRLCTISWFTYRCTHIAFAHKFAISLHTVGFQLHIMFADKNIRNGARTIVLDNFVVGD